MSAPHLQKVSLLYIASHIHSGRRPWSETDSRQPPRVLAFVLSVLLTSRVSAPRWRLARRFVERVVDIWRRFDCLRAEMSI